MTIANQLKSFHGDNLDAMMAIGDVYVSVYGSR